MINSEHADRESGNTGLNAVTGEFVDLVKAGVIDPAKVTRSALQEHQASIAGLLLTTEALVADKPEKSNGACRLRAAAAAGWRRYGRYGGHGLLSPGCPPSTRP